MSLEKKTQIAIQKGMFNVKLQDTIELNAGDDLFNYREKQPYIKVEKTPEFIQFFKSI